jgi:FkbM family methyltransferase
MVGPSGKVYAFEPDSLNFPLLERNIARHRLANVIPLQVAISDSAGSADFFGDGSLGSALAAHSDRVPEVASSRVRTISFKEACEVYGVPGFVKIDIEGAEVAVLSAASGFLRSTPIHFTLDTSHVGNGKLTNRAVEEIFRACNYEVESSTDSGFMTAWARPNQKD